jgi:hypothetical protein
VEEALWTAQNGPPFRIVIGVVLDLAKKEILVGLNGKHWHRASIDLPMTSVSPCMSMEDFSQAYETPDLLMSMNCGERRFQSPYKVNGKPVPGAMWHAQGEQAAVIAAENGHMGTLLLVLEDQIALASAVKVVDRANGASLLHSLAALGPVADDGAIRCAKLLLAAGNNQLLELKDVEGNTALCRAAEFGTSSIAKVLVEHGAVCDQDMMKSFMKHEAACPAWFKDVAGHITARHMDLSGCTWSKLPEGICQVKNLTNLILRGSANMESLSEDFPQLENLETLDLEGCESLKELPPGFGKLTNVKDLNLHGCKSLRSLPAGIQRTTHPDHP